MAPKPKFNASSGCWEMQLRSRFQAGPTTVQIFTPSHLALARRYPGALYPTGYSQGKPFGSGIVEAKKADLANKYDIICVYPDLTGTPWFGNSATNPRDQQENYIIHALVPYIHQHYPTLAGTEGRWLMASANQAGALTLFAAASGHFRLRRGVGRPVHDRWFRTGLGADGAERQHGPTREHAKVPAQATGGGSCHRTQSANAPSFSVAANSGNLKWCRCTPCWRRLGVPHVYLPDLSLLTAGTAAGFRSRRRL